MVKRRDYHAYIYLLPALFLMGVFVLYPVMNTILTSFKEGYRFLTGSFLLFSFENYRMILLDKIFYRAIINTSFIAFVCVPFSMLSALVTALLLNSIKRLKGFFMTLFYLPQVTNVIAAGMVFALIFNNHFGLINMLLVKVGINPVAWISGVGIAASTELYMASYLRCLFVLFVYMMWNGLSLKVILFLGGLQNIREDYYLAARLDGTSKWKIFRKITVPLLSPTTFYVFITSVITAFKAYSQVVALFTTTYGPAGDNSKMMITVVGYIIDALGSYLSAGAVSVASAAAVLLMISIMFLTAVQFKILNRWVHYK
jgi:multiple sugar transport system permease protein